MREHELSALGGHSQTHQDLLFWLALGAFACFVLLLALVYRRSCARVEIEEIDALLRDEQVF